MANIERPIGTPNGLRSPLCQIMRTIWETFSRMREGDLCTICRPLSGARRRLSRVRRAIMDYKCMIGGPVDAALLRLAPQRTGASPAAAAKRTAENGAS